MIFFLTAGVAATGAGAAGGSAAKRNGMGRMAAKAAARMDFMGKY